MAGASSELDALTITTLTAPTIAGNTASTGNWTNNLKEKLGLTHFAMLHDDVVPDQGQHWLDILLDEMQATGADLVSAVVPIKHPKGMSSVGLCHADDHWHVRRISMHEVFDLPETFSVQDVQGLMPNSLLLANTGCWLMKLEPWQKECGLTFRQNDRIVYNQTRKIYVAEAISEDWDLSIQFHLAGKKVACTRKVKLSHDNPVYHNRSPWGEWKTDEDWILSHPALAQ